MCYCQDSSGSTKMETNANSVYIHNGDNEVVVRVKQGGQILIWADDSSQQTNMAADPPRKAREGVLSERKGLAVVFVVWCCS